MVVVVSQDAEDSVDVIHDRVTLPDGPLRPRDFNYEPCDPTDPLSIYRIVKKELDRLSRTVDGQPYAIIDITGGRKVMSAAAALAAWQLKLDLAYLEAQFDRHTRHPILGTDRLIILSDPTLIFGEQEMARALEMFQAGAFESARRRYDDLCDRIEVPGRARFMRRSARCTGRGAISTWPRCLRRWKRCGSRSAESAPSSAPSILPYWNGRSASSRG